MEQLVAFLGRQPKISLAELESVLGAEKIVRVDNKLAFLNTTPDKIPFYRLGGTSKTAQILTTIDSTDLKKIEKFLITASVEHALNWPEGKLTIGFSDYGIGLTNKQLQKLGLTVKSAIKKSGRSVRLVPNNTSTLSDAQVLHNKLHTKGWELCLIRNGNQAIVAQTNNVQDLGAYTYRDRSRPARDAKVGMLPPKLAQIIVNLAVGRARTEDRGPKIEEDSTLQAPQSSICILDPFCGTGVLLQESLLMGFSAYGTDLEPRMVDYTTKNLEWLNAGHNWLIEQGDATSYAWDFSKIQDPESKIYIACETYLGKPFFKLPHPEELVKVVDEVNELHKSFLLNLASQTSAGVRMCIAVPAWAIINSPRSKIQDPESKFKHLPVLDSLEEIGYNRVDFVNASADDLIYHREGQVVARELLVLERI